MNDKYKNKYRIETTRLKNWDYGWNAAYFITIVTKNRVHYFGEIKNGKMHLSEIGEMAEKYWNEIPFRTTIKKFGVHYSRIQNRCNHQCTKNHTRFCMAIPVSRSHHPEQKIIRCHFPVYHQ